MSEDIISRINEGISELLVAGLQPNALTVHPSVVPKLCPQGMPSIFIAGLQAVKVHILGHELYLHMSTNIDESEFVVGIRGGF